MGMELPTPVTTNGSDCSVLEAKRAAPCTVHKVAEVQKGLSRGRDVRPIAVSQSSERGVGAKSCEERRGQDVRPEPSGRLTPGRLYNASPDGLPSARPDAITSLSRSLPAGVPAAGLAKRLRWKPGVFTYPMR
jgi:hypothetical protein